MDLVGDEKDDDHSQGRKKPDVVLHESKKLIHIPLSTHSGNTLTSPIIIA